MGAISDLVEAGKKFDLFKTILGSLLFVLCFYLVKEYLITSLDKNTLMLFLGFFILCFYFLGAYFFVSGYTDMKSNYKLDTNIKEIDFMSKKQFKEMEKIHNLKLKKEDF